MSPEEEASYREFVKDMPRDARYQPGVLEMLAAGAGRFYHLYPHMHGFADDPMRDEEEHLGYEWDA